MTSPRQIADTRRWPPQSFLELGGLPGAVPSARRHATQILWEWGLKELSDATELLVSELMTNAVTASQHAAHILPVRLWLLSDVAHVLILVWDTCARPPARVDATGEAESGRGLLLVEATSTRWDWYPTPETGGKVVWALTSANTGAPQ